jgi:S-formylglutathione hydrolase FrmB
MSPSNDHYPKIRWYKIITALSAIDLVLWDESPTIKDRRYRGAGGISHGGGIAARMAFQFPETFGSLGILSGGIASQEKETFSIWIASASADNLPRVRIDVGDRDGILPLTQNLTSVLDDSQVPYTLNVGSGDHNWTFWSPLSPICYGSEGGIESLFIDLGLNHRAPIHDASLRLKFSSTRVNGNKNQTNRACMTLRAVVAERLTDEETD